jgi:glutathione S-transferase
MALELYYWPTLQGRGEFVRLALEAAAVPYVDVARGAPAGGGGVPALTRLLRDTAIPHPPFAPPFLRDGELLIGQTAAILLHLGPSVRLVGRSRQARLWTHQIQLTIADMVNEAHDTHHPVAAGLYYDEQKPEARRRAQDFCTQRMPKFLNWFETVLTRNPDGPKYLVGARLSYADLSLFQLVEGLNYAFPRAAAAVLAGAPKVLALRERVAAVPTVAAYLRSTRRLPFNEQGIFRRYPELDLPGV